MADPKPLDLWWTPLGICVEYDGGTCTSNPVIIYADYASALVALSRWNAAPRKEQGE
jgi:hypothetical protein